MTNSSHRQIARAAAVVMITFIASRVLGLARDIVISAHYGTSDALDAYYAASRLNDLIFTLIAGGALASAFIPTFAGYLARDDETGAWRIASHIINILLIALSIVSLLAAIFAAPIVSGLLGIGFDPETTPEHVDAVDFIVIGDAGAGPPADWLAPEQPAAQRREGKASSGCHRESDHAGHLRQRR